MRKYFLFYSLIFCWVGTGGSATAQNSSECAFPSEWDGFFFQALTESNELVTAHQGKVYLRGIKEGTNSCFSYRTATSERAPLSLQILRGNRLAILERPVGLPRKLNIIDLNSRQLVMSFDLRHGNYDFLSRIYELGNGRIMLTGLDYIYDKFIVLNPACNCVELEVRREGLRASVVLPLADRALFFNDGELTAEFTYESNSLNVVADENSPAIYYGGRVLKLNRDRYLFWGGCQNISGGECSRKLSVFDVTTGQITKSIPISPYIGRGAALAELTDGRVLIAGGQSQMAAPSTMTNVTRLLDLESGIIVNGRPMRYRRKDHVLVDIGGGRLRAAGGYYYRVSGTTFGPEPAPVERDEILLHPE